MRKISLLALALVPVLASCSVLDKKEPPPCPKISVLSDAAQVTVFRAGPGRDLTDVDSEVQIAGYQGSCGYSDNKLKITLQLGLTATRGPADTDRKAETAYFVAVPGFYPKPEAKAVFPVSIPFIENVTTAKYVDEEVTMELPWTGGNDLSKYEVFIGLQLTPDQLEHNRRQKQR